MLVILFSFFSEETVCFALKGLNLLPYKASLSKNNEFEACLKLLHEHNSLLLVL